jgi:small subunit ribosomal protein S16
MATKIRLRRTGRKRQPSYRIVVADSEAPRDGRFVALIGTYDPRSKTKQMDVNVELAKEWLGKGATPSLTVASLLRKAGCFGSQTPPVGD